MKRLLTICAVTALVMAMSISAMAQVNAEYYTHDGTISCWGGASTIPEAVAAPDDGKFIQMAPESWIILRFPDDYAAVPDGTDAADLRVDTYDVPYPAFAEVFVSSDGSTWTSVGVYGDTANIDLDLEGVGLAKYVKVDQADHYIDPAYPQLGFDLDAVVALNPGLIEVIVDIDIKPGSYPNPINPGSQGVIPIAILTTDDFDAATVDPASISIAGRGVAVRGKAEKLMARLEDVDGDGDKDLLVQVETQSDGAVWVSGTVVLTGNTYDGLPIVGQDDIIIVPPEE